MARNKEWAFDVHEFAEMFEGPIGFAPDADQRYPDRITGTVITGTTETRAVIIPKAVGNDNAGRYRRWVALPRAHWENITNRPAGWRYFILTIGLYPDGTPWWANLYDEQVLASQRDFSEDMGGFYRFDPGLTMPALLAEWGSGGPGVTLVTRDSPAIYRATLGDAFVTGDQAEVIAAIFDYADTMKPEPVTGRIDVDGPQMSFHFE